MLTLVQLFNLARVDNIDIFDGISMPVGSSIDKDLVINTILERCGLSYPMYADPIVMRSAITLWSAKNQYTFEHINKILNANYSPIENEDHYEEIIENRKRDQTDNRTVNTDKTDNNKITNGGKDNTAVEDKISAFNSDSYNPDSKTTTENEYGRIVNENKQNKTNQKNNNIIDEKEDTKTLKHIHGDSGAKSYELQAGEYEFIKEYNPYQFIAGLFENDLTLFIY